MTIHVLHGKAQSTLGMDHKLLTCKCQLHVNAGLYCAHTNISSMYGIIKIHDCSLGVTGPRGPRKANASIMAVNSAVLLECVLAPEKARWASVVMTRSKHDVNLSTRRSGNYSPSSDGFTIHNTITIICINGPPMIVKQPEQGGGCLFLIQSLNVGVVVPRFPPLCRSSRQSDS